MQSNLAVLIVWTSMLRKAKQKRIIDNILSSSKKVKVLDFFGEIGNFWNWHQAEREEKDLGAYLGA